MGLLIFLKLPTLAKVTLILALAGCLTGRTHAVTLPGSSTDEVVSAVEACHGCTVAEHGVGVGIVIRRVMRDRTRQCIPCQIKNGGNICCKQDVFRFCILAQLHSEFWEEGEQHRVQIVQILQRILLEFSISGMDHLRFA